MNKNKTSTYILLILSAIIWGTIAWKVYASMNEIPVVTSHPTQSNKKEQKDTLKLLLNYKDPFSGEYNVRVQKTKPVVTPEKKKNTKSATIETYSEEIPDFQYTGIMKIRKERQAIVSRNGESITLKQKDKIGNFTIEEITESQLIVKSKSKKYYLPL